MKEALRAEREILGTWREEVKVYPPFPRFQRLLKQITNQIKQLLPYNKRHHVIHCTPAVGRIDSKHSTQPTVDRGEISASIP